MIIYYKQDLFDSEHKCIAHGCNAQGVMGSGFALHIRQLYPEAFESYKEWCKDKTNLLGSVNWVPTTYTFIANCITQEYYGKDGKQYASYALIENSMKQLNKLMTYHNLTSVSMPKIGCGLGGADWNIVEGIINNELGNKTVCIYSI